MIYMDVTSSCKSPMNTGVQRMVRGFFRGLRRAGYSLTPLVWDPRRKSYCLLREREQGFLERPFAGFWGQHRRAQPERWANPVPLFSKFWREVERHRRRFDLVAHLDSQDIFFLPEIFQDNRIDFLSNLPTATDACCAAVFHDAIAWKLPEMTSPKRKHNFADYVRALGSFDKILAASEEAANDLHDFGRKLAVDFPSVEVAAWPADDPFTKPPTITSAPRLRPNILCVGTFEQRKNHFTLLRAAEKVWLDRGLVFELTLIGRNTADFGNRVTTEIARLRRAGFPVKWQRHVDDEKLVRAYDACAFTVFPSLAEGFGLPIIESLRRGRPCICGANGSLGERARGGGCFIVDQTDVDELAGAMTTLLTDKNRYARLCQEARARHFQAWQEFIAKQRPLFSPAPSLAYV